ncbi:MAG TPA: M23 family metallopeptidase [Chthoniobacterales bacterium]|nr:M23 family metallopeptidase [Chthoniobacterales bacterium]
MRIRFLTALAVAFFAAHNSLVAQHDVIDLVLPTDNDALFHGDGSEFYQYVDRDYHGEKSTPWEGGQYGFVRDPVQTAAGVVYTRFHEGIDIRCLHRDANGEPLDEVRAIAAGQVVYTSPVAGYSNYGKYIVIEHRWDSSPYFSLYGHLSKIDVQIGQKVERGQPIAVMGYTGTGINQPRAHLHLELNMIINDRFQAWYDRFYRNEPNHHGIYNGINLDGIDIARLYLELHKNPSLTIPEFLAGEETFYKVTVPRSGHFELPKNYPWMVQGDAERKGKSWEISFARSGVPLKIEPNDKKVSRAELTYVKPSPVDCSLLFRGEIAGRGTQAHLTEYGQGLLRLLTFPD